ncbi:hypothetical protein IFE17_10820 [Actinobacillus sp. GY-402]|nr:hypothetical protein IFE17_10820 [Actinobacillus sp. GY-402]
MAYYNQKRIKPNLKDLSSAQYRAQYLTNLSNFWGRSLFITRHTSVRHNGLDCTQCPTLPRRLCRPARAR